MDWLGYRVWRIRLVYLKFCENENGKKGHQKYPSYPIERRELSLKICSLKESKTPKSREGVLESTWTPKEEAVRPEENLKDTM